MDLPDILIAQVPQIEESSSDDSAVGFLSSSSNESDDSSDDEQIDEDILFPIFRVLLSGRPRTRILNFVETALAKTDSEFREDFRVSRQIFGVLLGRLEISGYIPNHGFGKPKKSACLSLLMTLWFLGNHSAHRDLANMFNISYSSVHRIVRRVIGWLVSLMPEVIVWPQGNEVQRVSDRFEMKADISGCIGAIDASHIPIIKPVVNRRIYYNRKQSYSLILQGVVDCDYKFRNVYFGEPGSFHDVRVLRRSDIYNQVERNIPAAFPNGTFLLGDKGYIGIGRQWIVTPFRDNNDLLPEQTDFNRRVSSTRVVVEQAFGILKARFRRLKKFELLDLRFVVEAVMAACVLHNMCQGLGDNGNDLAENDNDRNNGDNNVDAGSDNSDDDGEDDEEDNDEQVPRGAEVPPRQMRLFTQMYPDAVLPLRIRR